MLTLACACGGVVEVSILAFLLTTIGGWLGIKRFRKGERHEHGEHHTTT